MILSTLPKLMCHQYFRYLNDIFVVFYKNSSSLVLTYVLKLYLILSSLAGFCAVILFLRCESYFNSVHIFACVKFSDMQLNMPQ